MRATGRGRGLTRRSFKRRAALRARGAARDAQLLRSAAAAAQAARRSIEPLTGRTFADAVEHGIVLVHWGAAWSAPCRAFAPIYESASARHRDVVFATIDTDAEAELAAAFEIRSIPTLMAFRDGVLVFRHAGARSAAALDRLVELVRGAGDDDVRRALRAATVA